jgi:hypothetical protein
MPAPPPPGAASGDQLTGLACLVCRPNVQIRTGAPRIGHGPCGTPAEIPDGAVPVSAEAVSLD